MLSLRVSKMQPLMRLLLCACVLLILAFTACRQDMHDQPKYKPYRPSDIFEDGTSARPIVENTVPRGLLREDSAAYTGKSQTNATAQADVTEFPFPITQEALDRGQERFNIFCSPCHGRLGDGDGMIARRGFRRPPSFHIDRLREAPVGHFFDVITNGFGAMPDYASQIPPDDRWRIIAYIRALQLSQRATLADVPPEDRSKLEAGGKQ
jgi:mono/diheme cytochrome c family protein